MHGILVLRPQSRSQLLLLLSHPSPQISYQSYFYPFFVLLPISVIFFSTSTCLTLIFLEGEFDPMPLFTNNPNWPVNPTLAKPEILESRMDSGTEVPRVPCRAVARGVESQSLARIPNPVPYSLLKKWESWVHAGNKEDSSWFIQVWRWAY